MKITKRQIIMIGLCAVGAAVAVHDQLRASSDGMGPETASASISSPEAGDPVAMPPETPAREGRKIADRLKAAAERDPDLAKDTRDAFRAPNSWLPAAIPASGAAAAPLVEDSDQAQADAFSKNHPLQAVLASGSNRQAMIDGQCLVVGQKLDGFQLLSVGELSVVLASPGGIRVKLTLPSGQK